GIGIVVHRRRNLSEQGKALDVERLNAHKAKLIIPNPQTRRVTISRPLPLVPTWSFHLRSTPRHYAKSTVVHVYFSAAGRGRGQQEANRRAFHVYSSSAYTVKPSTAPVLSATCRTCSCGLMDSAAPIHAEPCFPRKR
ncbi:hypothetical protein BDM02DRAFT_3095179, partial [Thelephora ganbajun]